MIKARELEAKLAEMMGWKNIKIDTFPGTWTELCGDNLKGERTCIPSYLSEPADDLEGFQWICREWNMKKLAQFFKNLVALLASLEGGDSYPEFFYPHVALMKNYKIGMYMKAAAITHGIIKGLEEIER